MEGAARGWIDRARDVTSQQNTFARTLDLRVGHRYSGDEGLSIRVSGMAINLITISQLDNSAQIHHSHSITEVTYGGQIMGNEQVGQSQVALQLLEQVEDLSLDRDIQSTDRLIRHNQLGLESERSGDADSLTLATREFVRIAPYVTRVHPHLYHELLHAPSTFLALSDSKCA